jgi:hypothetical protein
MEAKRDEIIWKNKALRRKTKVCLLSLVVAAHVLILLISASDSIGDVRAELQAPL